MRGELAAVGAERVRLDQVGAGLDEAGVELDDGLGRAEVRLLGAAKAGAALETRTPMPPSATITGPLRSRSTKRLAIGGAYFRPAAGKRVWLCRLIELTSIGLGGSTAPRGPVAAASQGRVPQPLLMVEASLASGAEDPPHPHPGWGSAPPTTHCEPTSPVHVRLHQNCTKCRGNHHQSWTRKPR